MTATNSTKCPITAVDGFGPATNCPGHFDFTLLFEESILTIGPTIPFILIANFTYLKATLDTNRKVSWSWHLKAKQVGSLNPYELTPS